MSNLRLLRDVVWSDYGVGLRLPAGISQTERSFWDWTRSSRQFLLPGARGAYAWIAARSFTDHQKSGWYAEAKYSFPLSGAGFLKQFPGMVPAQVEVGKGLDGIAGASESSKLNDPSNEVVARAGHSPPSNEWRIYPLRF